MVKVFSVGGPLFFCALTETDRKIKNFLGVPLRNFSVGLLIFSVGITEHNI